MTTKDKIKYALIALGIIGAIAIVITLFSSWKRRDDSMFKEWVKANERAEKAEEKVQQGLQQRIVDMDQEIHFHRSKDSMLILQQQQTKVNYAKVPVTVRNYNNDELRRAVWEFE